VPRSVSERINLGGGAMFDTIAGLPVHALVVHAVVVGLPLVAAGTVLVTAVRRWRAAAGWVALADAALVPLALLARQSGLTLQRRLSQFNPGVAAGHGRQGRQLWLFALALAVAAGLAWWAARRDRWRGAALVLVVLAAAGAVGWTVVVGDSGARAVWEQTIRNTHAP
jgi:hypothetical protein